MHIVKDNFAINVYFFKRSVIIPAISAPTIPTSIKQEPQTTPAKKSEYPQGQRICSKNTVKAVKIPIAPPILNNKIQYCLKKLLKRIVRYNLEKRHKLNGKRQLN